MVTFIKKFRIKDVMPSLNLDFQVVKCLSFAWLKPCCKMENLPQDILLNIVKFLSMVDYAHFRMTCRQCFALTRQPRVCWTIYQTNVAVMKSLGWPIEPRLDLGTLLSETEKQEAYTILCGHGHVFEIQQLDATCSRSLPINASLSIAARSGYLNVVEYLMKQHHFSEEACFQAMMDSFYSHEFKIVEWFIQNNHADPLRHYGTLVTQSVFRSTQLLAYLLQDSRVLDWLEYQDITELVLDCVKMASFKSAVLILQHKSVNASEILPLAARWM